ncbi:MAG TPA: TetR/AcrR family transcriptional regulator [Capillimicrobium sp.]
MASKAREHPAKRSEPRERLLATASELFYAEGINSVGVNRIVAEAKVTLATFYRHFPGKQDLVVAYLQGIHEALVARADALSDRLQGEELVRAIGEDVGAEIGRASFRGCAFIKAASEFEDPESPVRLAVADHRRWYYELVRRAFAEAGHQRPGSAARHFVMVRDGAMTTGFLESPTTARRTLHRGVEGLLRSIDESSEAAPDDEPV